MAHTYGRPTINPVAPAKAHKADAVTVAERRAAFARLAPDHAELVRHLPDEALAVEAAPDLFARLRSAAGLLAKADAAESTVEANRYRTAAGEVLTAPARPQISDTQRAEHQRLLSKADEADETHDHVLAAGYRARAADLLKGQTP